MYFSAQRIGVNLSRDWFRLLAEAAAIGVLIWVFTLSSATDSGLSALERRVDGLDARISRIATELPEIRARIAYEALFAPFSVAVLTLPPVTNGDNGASETIFMIDSSTGTITQYRLSWTRDAPGVALAVAGALRTVDPRAISIAEEDRLSDALKHAAPRLTAIDANQSFVLYQPASAIAEQIQKIGAKKERERSGSPFLNWAQLARVLETSTWLKPQASSAETN